MGELTLTGICRIAAEDDYDSGIYTHDILFIPDSDSCKLPIMNYSQDESGNEKLNFGTYNDVSWYSEYGQAIRLGNSDDYSELNLDILPEDGSFIEVKVAADNVFIRNENNLTWDYQAHITEIEAV